MRIVSTACGLAESVILNFFFFLFFLVTAAWFVNGNFEFQVRVQDKT